MARVATSLAKRPQLELITQLGNACLYCATTDETAAFTPTQVRTGITEPNEQSSRSYLPILQFSSFRVQRLETPA
jgi:hypothetical protein